jgi:hypothetical protein
MHAPVYVCVCVCMYLCMYDVYVNLRDRDKELKSCRGKIDACTTNVCMCVCMMCMSIISVWKRL